MPPHPRTRDDGLDGLRALAALSVLAFHSWLYSRPHPSLPTRGGVLDHALFEARTGLVLFFVLTGFLLYRPYARAAAEGGPAPSLTRYLRRRVARIAPAYYVALAGTVALLAFPRSGPGIRTPAHPSDVGFFLAFAQNYSPATILRLNPVTWTLGVEVAFYALLPLLGALGLRLARRAPGRQWILVVALVVGGVGWNALVADRGLGMVAQKALPAFLPYFALGIAVAAWAAGRPAGRLGRRSSAAAVALGLVLVIANGWWHASAPPHRVGLLAALADLPAGVGFALLVAAAAAGRGRAAGWMGARPLAAVGVASYGLYLWHVPVILALRRLDVLPASFAGAFALALPLAVAAGAASWRLVERPALTRARASRGERGRERRAGTRPAHAAAAAGR